MLDLQIRNLERGLMIIKLALDATRHGNLDYVQRDQDDLIYKHFWGGWGHRGLEDIQIQLIDRVSNEEELRDRQGQWAYRLVTLSPSGSNEDDFFLLQNRRARRR